MAGWRIGAVVGHRDVIAAINLLQEHYYVSLPPFIQRAAVAALTGPQDSVRRLVKTYERRRNVFLDGLQGSEWSVDPPRSIFAWLPVPPGSGGSVALADELLSRAHLAVAPGRWFGEHGEGYVRVSLLAPEERLREAARRLTDLRQHLPHPTGARRDRCARRTHHRTAHPARPGVLGHPEAPHRCQWPAHGVHPGDGDFARYRDGLCERGTQIAMSVLKLCRGAGTLQPAAAQSGGAAS
jgi:hypothetical protein